MKKVSDILAKLVPPFEPCENCNSGWILDRPHLVANAQRLRRCSCWLAHQEKVQQALAKKYERERP